MLNYNFVKNLINFNLSSGGVGSLQSEIAGITQSDSLAVTEYQLLDRGDGELIMVTSNGQKGIDLARLQSSQAAQGQTITLSIDQATQLFLQQQDLNSRTLQLSDGSLQAMTPSLVQVGLTFLRWILLKS